MIMLDIDHFKRINDVFGHLVGDSVLRAIVQNISEHIRREDVLTRYGGEEFVVVLPETPYENAFICAEKLRELISDTEFQLGDRSRSPSAWAWRSSPRAAPTAASS